MSSVVFGKYVVIWIEADDEQDAEKVEHIALDVLELAFPNRNIQNRIQDGQP